MTREVTLAATQFACGWDIPANLDTAERLVREAAGRGAQIVLLQELFATPYGIRLTARRSSPLRRGHPLGRSVARPGSTVITATQSSSTPSGITARTGASSAIAVRSSIGALLTFDGEG